MKMKMKWSGGRAARTIKTRLGRNLHLADDVILDAARQSISIQGPPRSLPGDPPHMDSQRLRDSLYDEVDAAGLKSRFGSTEEHAVYTEIGTPHMAARPWFLPAIVQKADDAARELAK